MVDEEDEQHSSASVGHYNINLTCTQKTLLPNPITNRNREKYKAVLRLLHTKECYNEMIYISCDAWNDCFHCLCVRTTRQQDPRHVDVQDMYIDDALRFGIHNELSPKNVQTPNG